MDNAFLMGEVSAGLTFLDWSLYYFSGTTKFFNPETYTWETLVDNPIGIRNAHQHNKIHPHSLPLLKFCIEHTADKGTFHSMYVSPTVQITGSPCNLVSFFRNGEYDLKSTWLAYKPLLSDAVSKVNDFLISQNYKLLLLRNNKEDYLYHTFNSNRAWNTTVDEELMLFYNKFFHDDIQRTSKWDIREKLALSYRPFNVNRFNITPTNNHYEITVGSMLDRLDKEIHNILNFFNIIPVGDYDYWLTIYHQWQQMHDIKFYRDWKEILTSIVNGEDCDLTDYNLNFAKDIFIHHILLYKYNLNIKGYGVESMPTNTKSIHNLLEPNKHNLDQQYIKELCLNY